MKRLALCVVLGGALSAFADVDNTPEPPALVAMSGQYMPLHGLENGRQVGLEVEIAQLVLGNRVIKFIDARKKLGKSAIEAVMAKDVAYGLNAIVITPERMQQVDFSDPYLIVPYRLASAGAAVTALITLEATVAGSDAALRALQVVAPKVKLKPTAGTSEAIKAVLDKQADFAADDEVGLTLSVKGSPLQLVGPGFGEAAFAVAVQKGSYRASNLFSGKWAQVEKLKKDLGLANTTELFAHAREGRTERVRLLLDNGLSPAATDAAGRSLLRVALGARQTAVALPLLRTRGQSFKFAELGTDEQPGAVDLLCKAAGDSDSALVKTLLATGTPASRACSDRSSPLMAAMGGDWDDSRRIAQQCATALLLIEAGADLKATDSDGQTYLHRAWECPAGVTAALKKGANLEAKDDSGRTPLFKYAAFDRPEALAVAIAGKANLKAVNKEGDTAVCAAAARQNEKIIALLLDAGADVNAKCRQGECALHRGGLANMALLLQRKADPNCADDDGNTPLHRHASSTDSVKLLLDAGAKVDVKNKEGMTPYDQALQSNAGKEVLKLMEAKGAKRSRR